VGGSGGEERVWKKWEKMVSLQFSWVEVAGKNAVDSVFGEKWCRFSFRG
jgi:hypothetical protein